MPYHRGGRRNGAIRPVIQSFKKVINHAPTSRAAAATVVFPVVTGVDSIAAGQTRPVDTNVPTGCLVKYIEFQYTQGNLVLINQFNHILIGKIHSGQTLPAPNVVGGSPLRNQVFRQDHFTIGQQQSSVKKYKFKIPPRFQRMREGDEWQFITTADAIGVNSLQAIYKFYR